jgi:hypothetical protein
MSLLEKASGGGKKKASEHHAARTSLLARAAASSRDLPLLGPREVEGSSTFDLGGLAAELEALPPSFDSPITLWSILCSKLPVAALALFLPEGDFLSLAARSGYPGSSRERLPRSLATEPSLAGKPLPPDAKALLSPVLGIPFDTELFSAPMLLGDRLAGLWVFHDPRIEGASPEGAKIARLLSGTGNKFPDASIELPPKDPVAGLLAAAKRFPSVAVTKFDLSPLLESPSLPRGLEASTLSSLFLSACRRVISASGSAILYGESSAVCVIGPASDAELARFQLVKTLKRILPYFSAAAFPDSSALKLAPDSACAADELFRFLSD